MKLKFTLIIFIVLAVISKLFLVGEGLYTFPDEFRYIASQDAFEALRNGDITKALSMCYTVDGRPGLVLLGLLPAACQILIANFFLLPYNSPEIDLILFSYNIFIYVLILWVLFKIVVRLGFTLENALIAVFLYAVGVNSWLYIRHAFPYDTALLIILYAIHLLLKNREKIALFTTLCFSALMTLAFTVYPGFYLLQFAAAFYFIYLIYKQKNIVRLCFAATLPVIAIIGLFELGAKYSHKSYFLDAKHLSGTIIFGDFSDTLIFPLKYLWICDSFVGAIVFLLFLAGAYYILVSLFRNNKLLNLTTDMLVFLSALCLILFLFMVQGPLLGKMVFYGRIFHQFYPFIVIIAIIALQQIFIRYPFRYLPNSLMLLAFLVQIYNIVDIKEVSYPRNFNRIVQTQLKTYKKVAYHCEMKIPGTVLSVPHDCIPYQPSPSKTQVTDTVSTLHLVNVCYMWLPDHGTTKAPLEISAKILYQRPHFTNYEPYLFEGSTQIQREMYRKSRYIMTAFETP
jgi:hypothetical protein